MAYYKNRRMFLKGSTGFVLSIPLLPSLFTSRLASAAVNPGVKNLVSIYMANGAPPPWFPKSSQFNQLAGAREHILTANGSTPISDGLPSELNRHLNKMLILRGIDVPGIAIHANAAPFNATDGSVDTLDSILARNIYGSTSSEVDLMLLMATRELNSTPANYSCSIKGSVRQSFEKNPYLVYLKHFKGVDLSLPKPPTAPTTPNPAPTPPIDPAKLIESKTLDLVLSDIKRLKAHRRISRDDLVRLEQYLSYVESLEKKAYMLSSTSISSGIPQIPSVGGKLDCDHKDLLDYTTQLTAMAFMTGSTRLVTIAASHPHEYFSRPGDLGNIISANNYNFHGGTHGGFTENAKADIQDYNEKTKHIVRNSIVRLLDYLDVPAHSQTNEKLMDQTLIVFASENGTEHNHNSVPVILASGNTNVVKGGRLLDLRDFSDPIKEYQNDELNYRGMPIQRLLIHIFKTFGLSKSQYSLKNGINFNAKSDYIKHAKNGIYEDGLPYVS